MKKSRLLGAVCFCLFSAFAQAATITYSGSDLYNDPSVSFPTTTPTLDGTSLVFGTGGTRDGKLLVLPLFSAGSLSTSSPTIVSIAINFTRLACDTNLGCAATPGENDSDHHIVLGDGTNLVGGAASDIGPTSEGHTGVGSSLEYTDEGNTGGNREATILFGTSYPDIGSSFDVNLLFTLDTTTTLDLSFLGGSDTAAGLQGLDRTAAIDFVFLSEGDSGEQYQINSLTVTSDASFIPIPPALWLFGSGLLGFIGVARR